MTPGRRVDVQVELPVTPEQAWEAIATGPGISAWFMPAEVEGRAGGAVVHRHDGKTPAAGTVTAYEPPRRFAYEEPGWGPGTPPVATEFLVEARSGGTCAVRVVMSGFGDTGEWDQAIESFTAGWGQALNSLRLYLTHFAGEPMGAVYAGDTLEGERDRIWAEFVGALGLPAEARPGERLAASRDGVAAFAGTVEEAGTQMYTLLLDEPARGIGFVGAGGPGDETYVFVRAQLFGAGAPELGEREQRAWREWFARRGAPAAPQ